MVNGQVSRPSIRPGRRLSPEELARLRRRLGPPPRARRRPDRPRVITKAELPPGEIVEIEPGVRARRATPQELAIARLQLRGVPVSTAARIIRRAAPEPTVVRGIAVAPRAITPVSPGVERLIEQRRAEQEAALARLREGRIEEAPEVTTVQRIQRELAKRELKLRREGRDVEAQFARGARIVLSPLAKRERAIRVAAVPTIGAGLGFLTAALGRIAAVPLTIGGTILGVTQIPRFQEQVRAAELISPEAKAEVLFQRGLESALGIVGFRAGARAGAVARAEFRTRRFEALRRAFEREITGEPFRRVQEGLPVVERRTGAVLRARQLQLVPRDVDVTERFIRPQLGRGVFPRGQVRFRPELVRLPKARPEFKVVPGPGRQTRLVERFEVFARTPEGLVKVGEEDIPLFEEEEEVATALQEFLFRRRGAFPEEAVSRIGLVPEVTPTQVGPEGERIFVGITPTQQEAFRIAQQISPEAGILSFIGIGQAQVPTQEIVQLPALTQIQQQRLAQIQLQRQRQRQLLQQVQVPTQLQVPLLEQIPVPIEAQVPAQVLTQAQIQQAALIGLIKAPTVGEIAELREPRPGPTLLQQGFDVLVKRKLKKVGKKRVAVGFRKVNKQVLSRLAALGLGASIVDRFSNRSFRIRPTTKRPTQRRDLVNKWIQLRAKFRQAKRNRNTIVERALFAIDTRQEKEEIPFAAARLRRARRLQQTILGVQAAQRRSTVQNAFLGSTRGGGNLNKFLR